MMNYREKASELVGKAGELVGRSSGLVENSKQNFFNHYKECKEDLIDRGLDNVRNFGNTAYDKAVEYSMKPFSAPINDVRNLENYLWNHKKGIAVDALAMTGWTAPLKAGIETNVNSIVGYGLENAPVLATIFQTGEEMSDYTSMKTRLIHLGMAATLASSYRVGRGVAQKLGKMEKSNLGKYFIDAGLAFSGGLVIDSAVYLASGVRDPWTLAYATLGSASISAALQGVRGKVFDALPYFDGRIDFDDKIDEDDFYKRQLKNGIERSPWIKKLPKVIKKSVLPLATGLAILGPAMIYSFNDRGFFEEPKTKEAIVESVDENKESELVLDKNLSRELVLGKNLID